MGSFRDIVDRHALPIKISLGKFHRAKLFDNGDDVYSFTSRHIKLGLEYLDTVENTFYLLGLSKQYLRLAKECNLLIKSTSGEYIDISPDRTEMRRNHSDYHGKPINHDRAWVKREIEFKYQDEDDFLIGIDALADEIDHKIDCFVVMADVFEDAPSVFMANWAKYQDYMFWFKFEDFESENEDV